MWALGFAMLDRERGVTVGDCGYKGPPGGDGSVEIAYSVAPDCRGRGYATEAAAVLITFAFTHAAVRIVRAHTLPETTASTTVLDKCGFRFLGAVVDPEDGVVWRWEKRGAGAA